MNTLYLEISVRKNIFIRSLLAIVNIMENDYINNDERPPESGPTYSRPNGYHPFPPSISLPPFLLLPDKTILPAPSVHIAFIIPRLRLNSIFLEIFFLQYKLIIVHLSNMPDFRLSEECVKRFFSLPQEFIVNKYFDARNNIYKLLCFSSVLSDNLSLVKAKTKLNIVFFSENFKTKLDIVFFRKF